MAHFRRDAMGGTLYLMPKAAQERTSAFREQWVGTFALALVWFGGLFEAFTFLLHRYQPVVTADFVHFAIWLGLSLAVVLGAGVVFLARYIVIGLLLGAGAAIWAVGYVGPTGPMLGLSSLAAAVLFGRRWAFGSAAAGIAMLFAGAYLHVHFAPPLVRFSASDFGPWVLTLLVFVVVVVSSTSLVNQLLRDMERVAKEFDDARQGLLTAGELRVAAENARDAAIRFRTESRSVEALGVVAGGVVHDLRNMAQVIRTWAGEIARAEATGPAADASQGIVESCDRLNHLATDVLALGQAAPSTDLELSLAESLPKVARALRRFLREDIRIVVDSDVPRGLPLLPITSVDLVHLILEAAAAMNITSIGSGTLIVSAPRAAAEVGPPPIRGTSRYPALISLELQRDGNVKSTREWLVTGPNLAQGIELAHTSTARSVLWCPEKDTALLAFDLYDQAPHSVGRIPIYGGADS